MMSWSHIVIHHSAGKDTRQLNLEAIKRDQMARGFFDVAYHFIAEMVGDYPVVTCGRPIHERGGHAGSWNGIAIGFCFVGNFSPRETARSLDINTGEPGRIPADILHPALLHEGARQIAGLLEQHEIPLDRVVPHWWAKMHPPWLAGEWELADWGAHRNDRKPTECPGLEFPYHELIDAIEEAM